MEDEGNVVVLAVGRPEAADELRRICVRAGMAHGSLVGHARKLRRLLAIEPPEHLVLCVSLDERTLARHGRILETLIWDVSRMESRVRVVGLLPDGGLTPSLAGVGCDMYVSRPEEVREAVAMIREGRGSREVGCRGRWRFERSSRLAETEGPPPRIRQRPALTQGDRNRLECEPPADGEEDRHGRERSVDLSRSRWTFRKDAEFDAM